MPGTQIFPLESDSLSLVNESFGQNPDGTRKKILVFAEGTIDFIGDRDYFRLALDPAGPSQNVNAYFSAVLVAKPGTSFAGILSIFDGANLLGASSNTQGAGVVVLSFEGNPINHNFVVQVSESGDDATGQYLLFLANYGSSAQLATSGNDSLIGHEGLVGATGDDTHWIPGQ
jgi:hypothetical protein